MMTILGRLVQLRYRLGIGLTLLGLLVIAGMLPATVQAAPAFDTATRSGRSQAERNQASGQASRSNSAQHNNMQHQSKSQPMGPTSTAGYYRVQPGDSLGEIARYYGVTVKDIKQANGLTSSTIYVGQRLYIPQSSSPTTAGCVTFYTVRKGDTLTRIAARYGINVSALARANGLNNASYIVVGQRICVPQIWGNRSSDSHGQSHGQSHGANSASTLYLVRPGDTLSQIAKSHGTSMRYLMQLNGIQDPNRIYVGQRLKLA